MSAMKYFAPALAIAGGALAQSSCSNSATTTISAAADASALSGCSTYSGSIAIATGLGDPVTLSGIKRITGDLVATNNSQIPSISADSLQIIGGAFNLDGLTVLSTLSFPQLTQVDSIVWNALAGLQGLSFSTGVQQANELNIQNTQLQSLEGINLEVVDTVYIANNNWLNDIEMQLGNITTSLIIEANGGNVSAMFPNLIWANNMTFRNVSEIALNSLVTVNGSLGFYDNEFENLMCANLTNIGTNQKGGDLTIVSNSNLNNVSMPSLKKVGGGLSIQNNTEYKSVNFPVLATVTGAFDLYGNFTNSSFPALNEVDGAFNLQSSADFDCSAFQSLHSSNKIRGKYVCSGTVAKPSGVGSNPSSTGSSGSKSSSTGAASAMYVPTAAAGLMGVIAAMFGLL